MTSSHSVHKQAKQPSSYSLPASCSVFGLRSSLPALNLQLTLAAFLKVNNRKSLVWNVLFDCSRADPIIRKDEIDICCVRTKSHIRCILLGPLHFTVTARTFLSVSCSLSTVLFLPPHNGSTLPSVQFSVDGTDFGNGKLLSVYSSCSCLHNVSSRNKSAV